MNHLLDMLLSGSGILMQVLVVIALIVWLKVKGPLQAYYQAHTTAQERQLLALLGREAFAYAETVFAHYDGPAKRNEALKYLLDKAKSFNLSTVDMQDLRAVIESAWLDDRRQTGLPVNPPASAETEQR